MSSQSKSPLFSCFRSSSLHPIILHFLFNEPHLTFFPNILKNGCHKSRINCDPPPQKRALFLSGTMSTFWILRAFNSRILVKIFLVKQWGWKMILAEIFGRSTEISAAQPQMKFQKLEKCRVKIQKICLFFSQMRLKVSHHASKKIFESFI